ncbi:MAG TPA: Hsp70 family protein [Blastocatellia bacterium]|nr:Hsp70 family protein [Blastocatellia bacterium]
MLLGIDYGNTRTVAAAVDDGKYPVVSFQSPNGDTAEWYPSLVAAGHGRFAFGLEAAAQQDQPGWSMLRSFKRQLGSRGPDSMVELGGRSISALDLLTGFLSQLRHDLVERSNLTLDPAEELEALISVPANANSNQRFNTLEAFRRAGFRVRGMINEPSAAGMEYAHRYIQSGSASRREHVVVYDLGGGTFDASVITMADRRHEVISSDGVMRLGGDDFDRILLDLAVESAGLHELAEDARNRLLDECREQKEGLHPNTRKVVIDLNRALDHPEAGNGSRPGQRNLGEVVISAAEYYERCRPLVDRTVETMERCMTEGAQIDVNSVSSVYLVGGSSDLPIVARTVRERYGRLVKRSPYPHASTAIGLAIAADRDAGYSLSERFTRHFGVWREGDEGRAVVFDVLFPRDTKLSAAGPPLTLTRSYSPTHNIGHFRYLECSRMTGEGHPAGEITPWAQITFPFAPELQNGTGSDQMEVVREHKASQSIEEIYSCDKHGIIQVQIVNHTTGYHRTYRLTPA